MKAITYLLFFISISGLGQVKGNKKIETKFFHVENLEELEIGLYANIIVDVAGKEGMTITADNNLFKHIDAEVVDGKLNLSQLKWIQPSVEMIIKIGAPNLNWIQNGTNNDIEINNVSKNNFAVSALNGTIRLNGKVETLNVNAENGTVDASKVKCNTVNLNIWGDGKGIVAPIELLNAKLSNSAVLELKSKPNKIKGNIKEALSNNSAVSEIRYINFKIKNNSNNRYNFYVVGPKPNGKKFSYGFPMMPGSTRKESWTTGTKIYKVGTLGMKTLIRKIKFSDENKIVNLF